MSSLPPQPPQSPGSSSSEQPALRAAPPGLKGKTTPRLWTPPLRQLNRRTSDGYDVADFAAGRGHPLLPWQRWTAIHGLELNPDGTYRFRIVLVVVARQQGKSDLKREISLHKMFMFPRLRVVGIAQEVGLAREQWNLAQESIHEDPFLEAEFDRARNVNGDEMFWLKNKSRYAIKAASRKAGRGGSNDEVNFDELREQRDWASWAAVSKTTMAKPNSQIWAMSNAGDDESVVLNQLREVALTGRDPTIGLFEYSAHYEGDRYCDIDDWPQIAQACPGLGYICSAQSIATAMTSDPPGIYRTEVLCQRVRHIDAAIDLAAWNDCADPGGNMDSYRSKIILGFDIAPDEQHSTLVAAATTPDGRIRVEAVAAWKTTDEARAALPPLIKRIKPIATGWFPTGPAAAFADILRPARGSTELTGSKVTEACQAFADLVRTRQILHPGDPLLDAHIAGAQKLPSGDGWRFSRKGDDTHVDGAYAAAGAAYTAATQPAPARAVFRAISL